VQASRLDESVRQFSSAEKATPTGRNQVRMMYTASLLKLPFGQWFKKCWN
jgi:hypothetical protein